MITVRVGLASDQRLSAPGTLPQSAFSTEVRAGMNHPYGHYGTSLAVEITQYIERDDNTSIQETPISPTDLSVLKPPSVTFSSAPSVAMSQLEP